MGEIDITIEQLRGMIGLNVRHNGNRCQVVEVLEDGPSLVLQCLGRDTAIQADQHGEAHRRVPPVYTIAILSEDKTHFAPRFLGLEPLEETD